MHLTSLHLRNYRVYRELDLEFPDGLVGIYGPNGSGKCLPGHVRVFDAENGGMVPISQFVQHRGKRTLGLRDGRIQPVDVVDWVSLGDRPAVELTLKDGSRVELAATHPVLTDQGCIQAQDLTPDHWVAQASITPALGPGRCSVDEALMLGILLGDGSLSTSGIVLTCADTDLADLFRGLAARLFAGAELTRVAKQGTQTYSYSLRSPLDATAKREHRLGVVRRLRELDVPLVAYVGLTNVYAVLRGDRGLSWEAFCGIEEDFGIDLSQERDILYPGRALLEWIRAFGLLGRKAGDKYIPPELLTLPDEQTWALLAGLWLTDGWVIPSTPDVGLVTKSRQLADDIRLLLTRVGVRSSMRERTQQDRSYWHVSISDDGFPALRHMPLVGYKAARRDAILDRPPAKPRGATGDLIPPSFNTRITRWTSPSGRNRGPKQRHHAMNRPTYRDFAGPGSVADEDTRWAPVRSVRATGRSMPCYDLEIGTPEHLYLAESFVVHNSTLIESLNYALYGISRTPRDELRSAGVGDDLRVTLTFDHEDNAYEVRRVLKGVNLTPQVQVFRNGQLAVSSVREANAWLADVVGMTPQAFQASVCAQQKELTAFATMQGAERRRLVLDLLGVSPVERALRKVREATRDARSEASGARQALVPLEALEQSVADAGTELATAATAAEAAAEAEQAATAELAARRADVATAEQAVKALDELRAEARLARADAEQRRAQAASHETRAAEADRLAPLLQAAEARAAELPAATATLETLDAAKSASAERAGLAKAVREAAGRLSTAERAHAEAERAAEPAERLAAELAAAEERATAAEQALVEARERYAGAGAELSAAGKRLEAAKAAVAGAGALDPAAPCPTCGQALGDAFEAVRAHRDQELAAAGTEAERLGAALATLETAGTERRAERDKLVAAREQARGEHERAAHAAVRAEAAATARAIAATDLAAAEQTLAEVPDPAYEPGAHELARAAVEAARAAGTEAAEHRARVARADEERALAKEALAKADEADGRAAALGERIEAMTHLDAELRTAREAEQAAGTAATSAHGAGRAAAEALRGAERRQADRAAELARARAAHERVVALDEQAAYLERTTDLVKGFRLHLVSRLGARLSSEAARLFADLTDNEYADLEIDPEDYSIRIVDGGVAHELARYSGSENDLASLSLRVAISLVIAEGTRELGLLVLDEVLGSLDRDRRERMLAALTSLQGRFRQVLLVTHNEEVKDLLPVAIEVSKGPNRTSTARLVG